MTSLHSLPSTWTAPTSCFARINYHYVLLESNGFSNLYGTPTPVGTVNTPSFTINVPYITDGGCPSGYTRACATAGSYDREPASTVTCCPSVAGNVFSSMCRNHQYGCHATATAGVTWIGVVTNIALGDPTEAPVTRKPGTAEEIEAWGIKFVSTSEISDSTSDSSAVQGPAENRPTEPGSLSTGAIAGIAVGAVASFLPLALAAFIIFFDENKNTEMSRTLFHN